MDTAYQAHLQVSELSMENIGWNGQDFVDLHNQPIQNIFKLYPWEWIWEEAFSQYIHPQTQWIEPCWKMLLSNKAILVELWKRYQTIHYWLKPIPMTRNKLCPVNG